jgi:hypothetical protein
MPVFEIVFPVFYYFETLLFLVDKCVEIYVYDNTGHELILVQLPQVACIVWTD